jgi:hypothetical protein
MLTSSPGQAQYIRIPYADFNALKLPPGKEHEADFILLAGKYLGHQLRILWTLLTTPNRYLPHRLAWCGNLWLPAG